MSAPDGTSAALAGLPERDRDAYQRFAAITDPVERAAAITAWGMPRGNLPPAFADLRADAIRAARGNIREDGRKIVWLALKVGVSASRISRIARLKTPANEGVAA